MKKMQKIYKNKKGFSLIELLLSMLIMLIVGGVIVSTLQVSLLSIRQGDDYITGRTEIEFVFNELRPQFTNIGLGMPNSKKTGTNSFGHAFHNLLNSGTFIDVMDAPVVVTIGTSGDSQLIYAWAVETGVNLTGDPPPHAVSQDVQIQIKPRGGVSDITSLDRIVDKYGQNIGILSAAAGGAADDTRSWVLFPSLRIPLFINSITGDMLSVTPAPNAGATFTGELKGFEEVHLLRIARIYVEGGKLKQQIYGENPRDLANHIERVHFTFSADIRLLSMTITAKGQYGDDFAATGVVASDDKKYRLLEETMTWRIRN